MPLETSVTTSSEISSKTVDLCVSKISRQTWRKNEGLGVLLHVIVSIAGSSSSPKVKVTRRRPKLAGREEARHGTLAASLAFAVLRGKCGGRLKLARQVFELLRRRLGSLSGHRAAAARCQNRWGPGSSPGGIVSLLKGASSQAPWSQSSSSRGALGLDLSQNGCGPRKGEEEEEGGGGGG